MLETWKVIILVAAVGSVAILLDIMTSARRTADLLKDLRDSLTNKSDV